MLGTNIAGKYRLARELGRGGMGSVYEAFHVATGKRVALKLMRPGDGDDESDRARLARFAREALAVGRLETQHVVLVYDAGVDEETRQPFLAMELLEGEDVSQLLKRLGPLRPELALAIVSQACAGLNKAHAAGIVHRDIKPSNLFLTKTENGDYLIKVLDFGIAKVSKELGGEMQDGAGTITETGALIGSPHYMSPEQAKSLKSIDHRSDLWSLGIVLHKCLSGRTPFDGHTTLGQVIIAVCSEEPTSVQTHAPWVTPELALAVRKALRRDPNTRYQTAAEFAAEIAPYLGPGGTRITADMLVPLGEELRARVAIRGSDFPTNTPSDMRDVPVYDATYDGIPVAPSSGALDIRSPPKVGVPSTSVTLGASFVTASVEAATKKPSRKGLWAVGAVAALGVFGGIGYLQVRGHGEAKADATTASASPPASAAPALETPPVVSASPASPAAATVLRSERLSVGPKGVSVEIDGVSKRVESGAVFVEGTPGSVHKVKLTLAGRETTTDVILSEQGAKPSKLELGAAMTSAPVTTKPTTGAAHTPATTTPATKPTSTTKGGTGFDRSFE